MNYPVQKPSLSIVVYGLLALAIIGLIAMGIAAHTAFSQVAQPLQAVFAAILIEAVMVIEAITIIRRNWWAAGGILISLTVSVTYNYIQAQQAGKLHGLTDSWQLFTLAVGPISALLFLALTIGHELSEHDKRIKAWEKDRQKWQENRVAKAEADRKEKEERQLEAQVEHDRMAQQTEIEKARIIAEESRKTEVAKFRAELRQGSNLPDGKRKETESFRDWRSLPNEDKALIPTMSTADIVSRYGVSDRTARNWRSNANHNGKSDYVTSR